jgi:hypothetical protein
MLRDCVRWRNGVPPSSAPWRVFAAQRAAFDEPPDGALRTTLFERFDVLRHFEPQKLQKKKTRKPGPGGIWKSGSWWRISVSTLGAIFSYTYNPEIPKKLSSEVAAWGLLWGCSFTMERNLTLSVVYSVGEP